MTDVKKLNNHITGLFQAIDIRSEHLPNWQQYTDFIHKILEAVQVHLLFNDAPSTQYCAGKNVKQTPSSASLTTYIQPLEQAQLILSYDSNTRFEKSKTLLEFLIPHLNNTVNLALKNEQGLQTQRWQSFCLSELQGTAWQINLDGEVINHVGSNNEGTTQGLVKQKGKRIYLSQNNHWIHTQLSLFKNKANTPQIAQCQLRQDDQRWIACLIYEPATNQNWLQTSGQVTLLLTPIEIDNHHWRSDTLPMTEAEARIITLFANGLSAEEVAKLTEYRVSTVYSYIKKFYQALGINKQSQLTATIWRQML